MARVFSLVFLLVLSFFSVYGCCSGHQVVVSGPMPMLQDEYAWPSFRMIMPGWMNMVVTCDVRNDMPNKSITCDLEKTLCEIIRHRESSQYNVAYLDEIGLIKTITNNVTKKDISFGKQKTERNSDVKCVKNSTINLALIQMELGGNGKEALRWYNYYLKKWPKGKRVRECHLGKGYIYYLSGSYKKSIDELNKAMGGRELLYLGITSYYKAWCHYQLREYKKAIDEFAKAFNYSDTNGLFYQAASPQKTRAELDMMRQIYIASERDCQNLFGNECGKWVIHSKY